MTVYLVSRDCAPIMAICTAPNAKTASNAKDLEVY